MASLPVPRQINLPKKNSCGPNRANIAGYKMVLKKQKNLKLYESLTQMKRFCIILQKNLKILCDLGKNKWFLHSFWIQPEFLWFTHFSRSCHKTERLRAGCLWCISLFGEKREAVCRDRGYYQPFSPPIYAFYITGFLNPACHEWVNLCSDYVLP